MILLENSTQFMVLKLGQNKGLEEVFTNHLTKTLYLRKRKNHPQIKTKQFVKITITGLHVVAITTIRSYLLPLAANCYFTKSHIKLWS